MSSRAYTTIVEVAYRDTDSVGHVSSTVYYNYMQNAYVKYMHHLLQLPFHEKIPQVMVRTSCDYLAPARFGDTLIVETSVTRFGSKSFDVTYRMFKDGPDRQPIATGASTHVMFDYAIGATRPVSDEFRALVNAYQGVGSAQAPQRQPAPA